MASAAETPASISGGCLCGSIRYKITFDSKNIWPPKYNTCQCTMCRKFTGGIVPSYFTFPKSHIEFVDSPTFTRYQSSDHAYRTFCNKCGSSLAYITTNHPDELDLFIGTIDEKWWLGDIVEGKTRSTPVGKVAARTQAWGDDLLGFPDQHHFVENAIAGKTDKANIMTERIYRWSGPNDPREKSLEYA